MRRDRIRSRTSAREKPLDDGIDGLILGPEAAGEQVDYLGILRRKEPFEGSALCRRGTGMLLVQIAQQQDVQFPHAAPAPPSQTRQVLAVPATAVLH